MTTMIENKTLDEIRVGETTSIVRAFRKDDVETWAAVTGNLNLFDLDPSPVDSSNPHGRRPGDVGGIVVFDDN